MTFRANAQENLDSQPINDHWCLETLTH